MEINRTDYFNNLFHQLSSDEQKSILVAIDILKDLKNRVEIEDYFKEEKYELGRTRKITSTNRFTYVIKVHDSVRLIIRVEENKVYVDSIIYKDSFVDKFIKRGED